MFAPQIITPQEAAQAVIQATEAAKNDINEFALRVLHTRGGRIGSGMGGLLEALWGYYVNQILHALPSAVRHCEVAWFPDHQYNDFACVLYDQPWEPNTRTGEFFRIEAKSMVRAADEPKAHFDALAADFSEWDLLVAIAWDWVQVDPFRSAPQVVDYFVGRAKPVADLRDALHLARGGTFVDRNNCPDGCQPLHCTHHGEPLNSVGVRERRSGPEKAKGSKVSYAQNFGGLLRMCKTSGDAATRVLREHRRGCWEADQYIAFVHRNFPDEELNSFSTEEWRAVAARLGVKGFEFASKAEVQRYLQANGLPYQEVLSTF